MFYYTIVKNRGILYDYYEFVGVGMVSSMQLILC